MTNTQMHRNDSLLIKDIMEKFNWKQIDVARFLGIGPANVSRYLKGTQGMHVQSRKALREKLHS